MVRFVMCMTGLVVLCSSCAKTLQPINLESYPFPENSILADSILVSSFADIQRISGNKRYSAKEHKWGMMCVAVRIENHSRRTFTVTPKNVRVYSDKTQLEIITPETYVKKVKQDRGWYLFHALWGHAILAISGKSFFQSDDGPGDETMSKADALSIMTVAMYNIPVGNIVVTTRANQNHLGILQQYQLFGRVIQPGDTAYGLVLVKGSNPKITFQALPEQ